MSDFTKEELMLIAESIHYLLHLKTNERMELLEKIDGMINGYCEHTPSDAHFEQFRWQLCSKCGVQYK